MYPEFCWVEGAWSPSEDNVPFHRKIPLHIDAIDDFRRAHDTSMVYVTTMRYNKKEICSKSKWKGKAIGDFYIDIDGWTRKDKVVPEERLPTVLNWTRDTLMELCQYVPLKSIQVWWSGMKGFHITVPYEVFGASPSDKLHLYWKYIAKTVCKHGLDLGRYSLRQLWRLQNSLHLESGLYKIPLYPEEVFSLSIEDITNLARKPRFLDRMIQPEFVDNAFLLYRKAQQFEAKLTWWMQK